MSDVTLAAPRTPTVYFIDDSATMREVMKIAFRKENIQVVTCPDAATALAQFEEVAPDAVITDVIMPDKDGYEVCDYIKNHERFSSTPVLLMSGVVNRTVAEKAMTVKADELIRKPFQPHDLILRVKKLLNPSSAKSSDVASDAPVWSGADGSSAGVPANPLSTLFAPPASAAASYPPAPGFAPAAQAPVAVAPPRPAYPAAPPASSFRPAPAPPAAASSAEIQKLRSEVRRLELLVKKLQAELDAARSYSAALEAHFQSAESSD
ncbi:MAG TPA: response regulator [Candidatus Acidoferrum sp.]|nr:response regulator [Candidatus Acidoferrum sp.]